MKKVILLIRVSDIKQNYETQTKELQEFVEKDGYSIEEMEIIQDKESGRKLSDEERQGLNKMYAAIDDPNNKIESVYCWELSRLSRKPSTLWKVKEYLEDKNINLIIKHNSLNMKEDKYNFSLIFGIYAGMCEQEIITREARFKRSRIENAAKGQYIGGSICFGYTVNSETKLFEVHPEQAASIRLIFELYATGKYGELSLFNKLRSEGIKNVERWMMLKVLQGIQYTGKNTDIVSGKKRILNHKYPQIISEELYNTCLNIRTQKVNRKTDKQDKNKFYANRVVKCYNCGKFLYARHIKNNDFSYICPTNRYLPENASRCNDVSTVPTRIIDSLALHYAYKAHIREMQTDRTKSINDAKQAIIELEKKINNSDVQYEIIKSDKRKKLKKLLSSITENELEALLIKEISADKQRINKEVIEWKEQIERHKQYISPTQFKINFAAMPKEFFDRAIKDGVMQSEMLKTRYDEISEQERYDLVHKYIDEILCRRVEKFGIEITIKLFNKDIKKILYYGRKKDKTQKLIDCETNLPMDYDYYIIQ
jgi:DNA invertase Pin-like site-specific DNA recombinase